MASLPNKDRGGAGQLAVVLSGETGLPQTEIAIGLARQCAEHGESVLLLDCHDGAAANILGLSIRATLADVLNNEASIDETKHITTCHRFSLCAAGSAQLDEILGMTAAAALSYDRLIVIAPPGCTPAHIRLTGAADQALLIFDAGGDRFMRGFWMMDAIRARAPKCDPQIAIIGDREEGLEAYEMFAVTVRDYLGAPPPLSMICGREDNFQHAGKGLAVPLQQLSAMPALEPRAALPV